MSLQLPDLNKVVSGLTSFPPKLSVLLDPLVNIEQQVQGSGLPQLNIASSVRQMAQQFESSASSLSLPQLPLPQLPFSQSSQSVAQPMMPASPLAQAPAAQPVIPTGSKFEVL